MSLLKIDSVSFTYNQTAIINQLNFVVNDGDYLCIIGENGSGKSTLIKGLLQLKEVSSGEIIMDPSLKVNEIGYLPQQTSIQKDFPASVEEIVLSGCLNQMKWRPIYNKQEKRKAAEMMKKLGIEHLKHQSYRELSGGQQQRVLLARALCATKKLLILDEPMSSLDPTVTQELYDLIYTINQEMGITIIMVSHDLGNSLKYATHVLHLKSESFFYGKKDDYVHHQEENQFLGGSQS